MNTAEYQRDYYARNKDRVAEQQRDYYARNKDRVAEQQRDYRARNKDRVAEQKRDYRAEAEQHILNALDRTGITAKQIQRATGLSLICIEAKLTKLFLAHQIGSRPLNDDERLYFRNQEVQSLCKTA